jgi:uncharacterized protein
MSIRLTPTSSGVRFAVKVVPGASRDRAVGVLGDALKLAVTKPASGGAANAAVVLLLAATLGVRESQVLIVGGHSSPRKTVEIAGLTDEEVIGRLGVLRTST